MSKFDFENDVEIMPEMFSFMVVGNYEETAQKYNQGYELLWSFNPQTWGVKVWFRHSSKEDHFEIDPEGDRVNTKGYLRKGRVRLFPGIEQYPFSENLLELVDKVISKNFPYNSQNK